MNREGTEFFLSVMSGQIVSYGGLEGLKVPLFSGYK